MSKGDRLLVIMQNRWQMATLHWACQFAGIIVTPVNWRSTAQDLEFFITDTEARAVAYDESASEAVQNCSSARSLVRITSGQIEDPDAHDFDSLLGNRGDTILRATAEDLSLMLYTSGTSGKPKGVPRLHRAERSAALAHVAQNLYRHDECTLGVMPLYHTMGVRSLLSMALVDGKFVCIPKFDPKETLDAIEREQISNTPRTLPTDDSL